MAPVARHGQRARAGPAMADSTIRRVAWQRSQSTVGGTLRFAPASPALAPGKFETFAHSQLAPPTTVLFSYRTADKPQRSFSLSGTGPASAAINTAFPERGGSSHANDSRSDGR